MLKFKKFFKRLAGFILLPLAVILSLYSLEQQGFFKIDRVDIQVATHNSQKNFIEPKLQQLQAKLETLKGISLWKAPLSQISKSLQDEKWIKSFQLSRAWPSGIELVIQPDDVAFLVAPVAAKNDSSPTELSPITQDGKVLESIQSNVAPNTIIAHDSVFLKNENVRNGAIGVIKSLPENGRLSAAQVAELGYDRKDGYWVRLLQSETKVNFGEDQFEIKSARISQVINYLESRNLKARVIDANLSKKVLVRLQQNP